MARHNNMACFLRYKKEWSTDSLLYMIYRSPPSLSLYHLNWFTVILTLLERRLVFRWWKQMRYNRM